MVLKKKSFRKNPKMAKSSRRKFLKDRPRRHFAGRKYLESEFYLRTILNSPRNVVEHVFTKTKVPLELWEARDPSRKKKKIAIALPSRLDKNRD